MQFAMWTSSWTFWFNSKLKTFKSRIDFLLNNHLILIFFTLAFYPKMTHWNCTHSHMYPLYVMLKRLCFFFVLLFRIRDIQALPFFFNGKSRIINVFMVFNIWKIKLTKCSSIVSLFFIILNYCAIKFW